MSTWGAWGYIGIVAGLLVMLIVFFGCMEILSSAQKTPRTGDTESPADLRENTPTGTKHAA